MSVARLKVEGLNKAFFGIPALRDVHFAVHSGEVLGIVGENGAGKSTAMNLIAGIVAFDTGQITLDGAPYVPRNPGDAEAAGISFIQQELNIIPNLTIAENLFLGRFPRFRAWMPVVSWRRASRRAREVLKTVDLDLNPDTLAERLSLGQRQLVEIARGIVRDVRVAIFDEPTSSLTRQEADRVFRVIQRLKEHGVGIFFISHALDDVLRLCGRVIVMRDGKCVEELTPPGTTVGELVRAMVGRSIDSLYPARSYAVHAPRPLLQVEHVGEPGVLHDNTFAINAGEIVGLGGLLGSGRTELARAIFGLDPYRKGTIRLAGKVLRSTRVTERIKAGVAFLTEDRRHQGLLMQDSVSHNMSLAALPLFARGGWILDRAGIDTAVRKLAAKLQLKSGPVASTPVRALSGGNQQKVLLGRWLLRHPSVLILDEPTRGVDVGAKEEIYRILVELVEQGLGILLISSDLEELTGLCDRILVMCRGHMRAEFARPDFDHERMLNAAFGQDAAA